MSACIPTYMLASSLIAEGMNWWQAVLTIFLGNMIVLIPMVLNAHAGTKYGIPFPVYCRASFGILRGERAGPAAGAGRLRLVRHPDVDRRLGDLQDPGHLRPGVGAAAADRRASASTPPQLGLLPGLLGRQHARHLPGHRLDPRPAEHQGAAADRAGAGAAGLGLPRGGRVRADAGAAVAVRPGRPEGRPVLGVLLPGADGDDRLLGDALAQHPRLHAATPTRSATRSLGQALGLPTTMGLYSFIGVAVTSATVDDLRRDDLGPGRRARAVPQSRGCSSLAMVSLCLATLATNIAANVVSPANDFAHLWPRRISFRTGGLITGVVGILIQPWKLIADPTGYIFRWLVAYSSLLGAVGGILIADYFLIRRTRLDLTGLYRGRRPVLVRRRLQSACAMIALVAGHRPVRARLPGDRGR